METQPPPLDYGIPQPPQRRGGWGQFSLGVFGGMGFSLLYYLTVGTNVAQHAPVALFGAVLLKIAVGVALLSAPGRKAMGLGLICSIPIAILIFVGLCFGLIALN